MIQKNEASCPLRMIIHSGAQEYKYVFSALHQKRKMKRGGTNSKDDPPTLTVDLTVRRKGSKSIWVKKEEVK